MTKKEKAERDRIRTLVAKLYAAAGCTCCRDMEGWRDASTELGQLLDIPEYPDGSGHNFYIVAAGAE